MTESPWPDRELTGLRLPGMLGTRYRIKHELGRGGMACVYLAEDLEHARDVAVKVIRPELAVSLGSARFLREIGIAARLRHPNILPLYDSGDADGVLYFVMPYEDGPAPRTRLDAGPPLTIGVATSALRDVARALAYAHEHGVVHRHRHSVVHGARAGARRSDDGPPGGIRLPSPRWCSASTRSSREPGSRRTSSRPPCGCDAGSDVAGRSRRAAVCGM